MEIFVKNVNEAFSDGIWAMRASGVQEQSRNGPVLVMPGPMLTTYSRPWERVLFNQKRDCNHVFHLVEAIWMLAGRNDIGTLLPFNSQYGKYAEEDGHVWGAYGPRWRVSFAQDQIKGVIDCLRANPESRRAVIQMWHPDMDLEVSPVKKDVPCNTTIYFDCRGGVLNMTVCNRSNDMLWGAYGANAVHLSMLQELIAAALKIGIGKYRQFSNNMHLYTDLPMVKDFLENPPENDDRYRKGMIHLTMVDVDETYEEFLEDCALFCEKAGAEPTHGLKTRFVRMVDVLAHAYRARKAGVKTWGRGLDVLHTDLDWLHGFANWVLNREKQDGGK
jgi:thymidylate synthase